MRIPETNILGDTVRRDDYALTFSFAKPHKVLSTSNLNGGIRRDLKAVFNHSCSNTYWVKNKAAADMEDFSILNYYIEIARNLNMDPAKVTGLSTAAKMENTAYARMELAPLVVEVFATAGLDVNAGRAGDPAAWNELDEKDLMPPAGTINLFIFIGGSLDDGAMSRALVMATEAKTSILQDLMISGSYSQGMATGTGTDGVVIVCDDSSPYKLTNAGKHSVLGEMIAKSVRKSLADALYLQSYLSPSRQCNIYYQQKRYGITPDSLMKIFQREFPNHDESDLIRFERVVRSVLKDQLLVAEVGALFHAIDQNRSRILPDWALEELAGLILPALMPPNGGVCSIPRLEDYQEHTGLPLPLEWVEPPLSLLAPESESPFVFPQERLMRVYLAKSGYYYEAVVCEVARIIVHRAAASSQ